jgi:hypothetical protein
MCNLYSITTNQAVIALFCVINRYVGNLAPMPGVFPDYKALQIFHEGSAAVRGGRATNYYDCSYRDEDRPQFHLLASENPTASARRNNLLYLLALSFERSLDRQMEQYFSWISLSARSSRAVPPWTILPWSTM